MTTTQEELVIGMHSLPGNSYDGHSLHDALKQAEVLTRQGSKTVLQRQPIGCFETLYEKRAHACARFHCHTIIRDETQYGW